MNTVLPALMLAAPELKKQNKTRHVLPDRRAGMQALAWRNTKDEASERLQPNDTEGSADEAIWT